MNKKIYIASSIILLSIAGYVSFSKPADKPNEVSSVKNIELPKQEHSEDNKVTLEEKVAEEKTIETNNIKKQEVKEEVEPEIKNDNPYSQNSVEYKIIESRKSYGKVIGAFGSGATWSAAAKAKGILVDNNPEVGATCQVNSTLGTIISFDDNVVTIDVPYSGTRTVPVSACNVIH